MQMIADHHRQFGKELVNSSGEFKSGRMDILERMKSKNIPIVPRYLKLNLWQEDKENQNTLNQFNSCDRMVLEDATVNLSRYDQSVAKDPQFVALYNQEIFSYLQEQELKYTISTNYMTIEHQPDLNSRMRAILVDWLVDVHLKFKLRDETLFMAIQIIDRYLSISTTTRQQLQLVGVAALWISCKYEEIYPPDLKDIVYITDNAYTKQNVQEMEGIILSALDFCITQPSSLCFLQRYARIAGLDTKNMFLAQYMMELALVDMKFIHFKPSHLASAAIYLVHKIRKSNQPWTDEMQNTTNFNEVDLRPCAKDLCLILQSADKSTLQAVRKKFNQTKYLEVSRIRVERQQKGPNQQ